MRICVYGAASPTIDKKYIELVEQLGKKLPSGDIPWYSVRETTD